MIRARPVAHSYTFKCNKHRLTLLLRQTTGQREHPNVQQQQMQPQKSHLTLTGRDLRKTLLILDIVALNSSGATW